ncbi:MAG: AAA family ATPase [Candidatus Aenigmatarchaeota archaeon]
MEIEINEKFRECLHLMENTRKNVFITGRAGTGKSTLLNYFRERTKKKAVVLAPTGVAAINVNGQTIHSFFRLKPDVNLNSIKKLKGGERELYRKLECIVIDEISMVRADLLDCVDKFLRLNRDIDKPFGGIQMIFFGDLYQLPPVVRGKEKEAFKKYYKSQYFFDSKVFKNFEIEFVELEKIYRQTDQKFIELLNSIRNNTISEEQLKIINERVDPDFKIPKDQLYVQLTTTNDLATRINDSELSKIKKPLHEFEGKIKGDFGEQYLPTDVILRLKAGSQIMLVNNDPDGRWVNGTVGKITEIDDDYIEVELIDGFKVEVGRYTWKVSEVFYNQDTDMIESRTIGSFTQYPIKLAWAITIHKSQGKTFDRVAIDLGRGAFTPGQVYVALSRCKTLDGIVLRKPISKKHIFLDWKIVNFLTKYQYKISEKKLPLEKKIQIIRDAIKNNSKLEIVYLKTNEEKSRRIIEPLKVGEMTYMGKSYIGVESFCHKAQDKRIFRVDRILEIRPRGE